jgi:uroporphyrinogen-III decarboxylase
LVKATGGTPAQAAYVLRWKRILDCVALKQPDRMPVALHATFWLAKYGGISCRELMYDCRKTAELAIAACEEFQPEICFPSTMLAVGRQLEATGFQQVNWPGHGVPDNRPYQYLDREYMKAEEYDEFLFDPTGFYLNTYLPRVATVFQGLTPLATLTGSFFFEIAFAGGIFQQPAVRQAIEQLTKAGEETVQYMQEWMAFAQGLAGRGLPMSSGPGALAPYDIVADFFRGATGMMKDLFRHKDKVLQVLDKVRILHLRKVLAAATLSTNPIVFIPVHWAPDAFMSPKQFETFWWPTFRRLLLDLIEAGLIPIVLWESDCTKRLATIRDVPAGKCVYWFERTDMVTAFEALGDVVALRGNISPSVLTTGTPQDVDLAVKHLVDNVWQRGGKLILDGAFGLPDETPVENVRAMFAAARKYAS